MTFEEFWEKNYAKQFNAWGKTTEPYYGIASYAFETGQQNCNCVNTDNSAVIEELQKRISELEFSAKYGNAEFQKVLKINEINEKKLAVQKATIESLKVQVEKMKCCLMTFEEYCKKCDDCEVKE